MRVKKQSSIPQVNLTPMMDVLMSVLTFFIILSMDLTGQSIPDVNLPALEKQQDGETGGIEEFQDVEQLTIGLNPQGEIIINSKPVSEAELVQTARSFLGENSDGAIILKADRELDYQNIESVLETLSQTGGGRVSLVVK
jgi:biopolymer transport protein ExbD